MACQSSYNIAHNESLSSWSLLKSASQLLRGRSQLVSQSVREKAQTFIAYALLHLPENELYHIPIDISEERRGDSLCCSTSIGMKHLLVTLMVAAWIGLNKESWHHAKNTKHWHILYSS
jgi:hypothetical protein